MKVALIFSIGLCFLCAAVVEAGEKTQEGLPEIDVEVFTQLRMRYAKQPDFSPYWESEDDREAVVAAYEERDTEKFLKLSEKWLTNCPVDAVVHRLRASVFAATGDFAGYFYHMHFYYGLLASITSSGDGRTQETAMKVIAVSEEYYVLRHIEAKLIKQSLISGGFDKMECEIDGEKITFYFDISISLDATSKRLNSTKED